MAARCEVGSLRQQVGRQVLPSGRAQNTHRRCWLISNPSLLRCVCFKCVALMDVKHGKHTVSVVSNRSDVPTRITDVRDSQS